ncbi:MAG: terminase large subunit [Lachnospiraceae bacterium]|nr:terminase large subunit [Lachnospiraceae bacterium]
MTQRERKHWNEIQKYAKEIQSGKKVACEELRRGIERFFRDLENPQYELDHYAARFCIEIIEKVFKHQQGERLDGTPLRGEPFLLQPWQKFIIYNLVGFKHKGTGIVRFHEAMIYVPRKQGKTSFSAALAWALALWYRKSGSKVYVTSAAMLQSLETFNFIAYNVKAMGEDIKDGGSIKIIDNNNEHSLNAELQDGTFFIRALAANPDTQDSLNCNVAIADEIHAFKAPKQYNLFKEAMKAYTNKLMIGISTAGDNEQGFLGQRLQYCRKILDGQISDEQYFIFMCCANPDENGNIDFTNPLVHEMANPSYGVSVRPEELLNDSLQAQNDPQQRKDFFAKSLNVFTNAMKAYFDTEEFRRSDAKYDWTIEQLAKLNIDWYGGADLSRTYDLTAAALFGNYKGTDIIITHAFFPVTQAAAKADEDGIPLFGWEDDGWLTMCNSPTVNTSDVVNWFIEMRRRGFKIRQVGHDRKFAREYMVEMKRAKFNIIDQPQYYYVKSEGFRRIEKSAKDGNLYYLHSDAFEYCVSNVRAVEKSSSDDMVIFEKVQPQQRIDLFDAAVTATCRYLDTIGKNERLGEWFKKNEQKAPEA